MGREYAFTIPGSLGRRRRLDSVRPLRDRVGYSFGVIDTAVMWINEYANSRSQKSH